MSAGVARFKPGANVPVFAASQIQPGRFVKVIGAAGAGDAPLTAYPAAHCAVGERAFGVSEGGSGSLSHDTYAWTRMVTLLRRGVVRVEAGAAVAALAEVQSDGVGRAVALDGGLALGHAVTAAEAPGDVIEVALRIGAAA